VALLPLGLAMALWTAPVPLVDLVARLHRGCLYRVPTQAPVVALTVDDGPDSVSTPLILNALRREQARATFFLITQRLDGREPIVRAMVAAGHEVGNHFTSDRASIRLTANEFEADLVRAHKALRRYGPVTWARPGSGWHSGAMIETMQRHGYRCSLGSVYPLDAAIPSASFAARYVLRNVRPGAIVVLHDGGARGLRTARALGEILPELRRRGYRVVTLSKLVSERLEWPPGLPPPQAAVE
jgi:peptidoglycan/xylan/chitin deacetylase (PgdA/CDA1 family)